METPDVTRTQIIAWAVGLLTSASLWAAMDATDAQKGAIIAGLLGLLGVVHTAADAYIRGHRVPLALRQLEAMLGDHPVLDGPDGDDALIPDAPPT